MSRKDYREVAKILAKHRMTIPTDEWVDLIDEFAQMFRDDNPSFSTVGFKEACFA